MRRLNWTMAAGLSAALLATLATNVSAQTPARARAPFVHIYSRAGQAISNYVEPSIEVGEDAYVFAVSIDLDGQIQVLHPEYAGLSVKLAARRELQLKNFFAGFRQNAGEYAGRGSYGNSYNSGYGDYDGRGVIIALASRAPFNFDLIYTGNDWNMSLIRSLVEHNSPTLAANNLARYIGAPGEPIGRDFMIVTGQPDYRYAYVPELYVSQCDLAYLYGAGGSVAAINQRTQRQIAILRSRGQTASIVGYDGCGRPIVSYGPTGSGLPRLPVARSPHGFPRDTTIFPKTQEIPATGAFPAPRRAGTIPAAYPAAASPSRAADPRVIIRESGRRVEPQASSVREPFYSEPVRMPRVEREATGREMPAAPAEPRVINQPAQGAFGGSRASAPPPQPRVIAAPSSRPAAPPARTEPASPPPRKN